MRNVNTREGYEFWDKICAVQSYAFLLSPDGRRVVKTPDIGDWIDKHEAQVIVDQAQEEFNFVKAERDALQAELTKARELIEQKHDALRVAETYVQSAFSRAQLKDKQGRKLPPAHPISADLSQILAALSNQAAPADDSYPPCDYCGTVPDYHPWHGSGMINGQESPHIHACNDCRGKLPAAADKGQGGPLSEFEVLRAAVKELEAMRDVRVDAKLANGEPVAWANWKVRTKSYVPFRTKEEASRSVERSEIAATQLGPYEVVPLYAEQPAPVAAVLAEAREWLGDGKHADGLAREHWTPEYAALIDRIDATLSK